MHIRHAEMTDLNSMCEIEAASYPEAEGASVSAIRKRLEYYPDHFWILEDENGKILAFVNGFVTNEKDLSDEMYERAEMHDEDGAWQMIFSVVCAEEYRHQGYASLLMRRVIQDAKEQKRKGIVLTCKTRLIPFYEKFGFVNEGISESVHGNVSWNQMRLSF